MTAFRAGPAGWLSHCAMAAVDNGLCPAVIRASKKSRCERSGRLLRRNISASTVSNANGVVCLTGETHAETFGPVFDTVDVHGSAAGGSRYHAGPRGDDQQQAH